MRLNSTCAAAARRAFAVAPAAAMAAVTVVPMLVPMTTAAAPCAVSRPDCAALSASVSAALELCISTVMNTPTSNCISTAPTPLPAGRVTPCATPSKASLSTSMPMNSRPNPASAVPSAPRRRPAPLMRRATPRPTSGRASASIFTPKPSTATIQPVIVVPTLAPNTTHSDWEKLSSPALTKPITATVTALDDCTSAVTPSPASRPRQRVRVEAASRRSSAGPAASRSPLVMSSMPSRNRPTPPTRPASTEASMNQGVPAAPAGSSSGQSRM